VGSDRGGRQLIRKAIICQDTNRINLWLWYSSYRKHGKKGLYYLLLNRKWVDLSNILKRSSITRSYYGTAGVLSLD
jgi:hypothetical protein